MRALLLCGLVALVAGCDAGPASGEAFVYATSGTDAAVSLIQAGDGSLVVVGSVEGRPRPADGTLALPAVLRFSLDGGLQSAEVYRDIGFGYVSGATPAGDGLALTVSAGPDEPGRAAFQVFQADVRGRRSDVLFRIDGAYALQKAVSVLPGGDLVVAVDRPTGEGPHVYRLGLGGAVVWAVRVEGAAGVTGLAVGPAGEVYAQGFGSEGGILARLRPENGTTAWRQVRADAWSASGIAALPDGVARVESRNTWGEGSAVRVVRLGADGVERSAQVVAEVEGAAGNGANRPWVQAGPIAGLPDGRVAVGWTQTRGGTEAPDAFVAVVGTDVGPARRFGREGRWPILAALAPLADGRLAAAGATGPRTVSGYGGDDFDVLVALYDVD